MYLKLNYIFLFSFIFELNTVAAFNQRIVHFKVLHKTPKLVQCVGKILQKKSNAVRVSKTSDKCEELYGHLDEEFIDQGYGYAQLFSKSESFKPPIELQDYDRREFNFSGPLNTGACVDLYVTWPENSILDFFNKLWVTEGTIEEYKESFDYNDTLPRIEYKISFVAVEENSLKMLFNDKTMVTWEAVKAQVKQLSAMDIKFRAADALLRVHGYEYNEGKYELEN